MRLSGEQLNVTDVYTVAVEYQPVEIDAEQINKVKQCYERVQQWGARRKPIYGVNTGFGELINFIIPPRYKSDLQYNLVRSHAAGGGQNFPDEVVRAVMLVRLNCLLKGHSGASPHALELLGEFLNRHIHPLIPEQGSLGASGDLAPLSHMALALIGDGVVRFDGVERPAAEVLKSQGLEPVVPGFKEALALINGTSAMTGAACLALVKAQRLLKLATLASVDVVQCLGGSTRPFDPQGHELKNHPGQIAIARLLRNNLEKSSLTRRHVDIMRSICKRTKDTEEVAETDIYLQNAYSMRCIPQILGPVLDTLRFCRATAENELNSANDNPLFFDRPEDTFHGGNFHGQYIAMACDFLNIALAEIGVLAERQLDRLISPQLNGNLPQFLAHGKGGLFCGFEGGQYLATSIASENLDLAAPASIKSIPSNGANQDVVSMGLIAARKSLKLCEHVNTILGVLLAACYQASHFVGGHKFNPVIERFHQQMSKTISVYRDDAPFAALLSKTDAFLASRWVGEFLDEHFNLEDSG